MYRRKKMWQEIMKHRANNRKLVLPKCHPQCQFSSMFVAEVRISNPRRRPGALSKHIRLVYSTSATATPRTYAHCHQSHSASVNAPPIHFRIPLAVQTPHPTPNKRIIHTVSSSMCKFVLQHEDLTSSTLLSNVIRPTQSLPDAAHTQIPARNVY